MILPGMNYQDSSWGRIKSEATALCVAVIQEIGVAELLKQFSDSERGAHYRRLCRRLQEVASTIDRRLSRVRNVHDEAGDSLLKGLLFGTPVPADENPSAVNRGSGVIGGLLPEWPYIDEVGKPTASSADLDLSVWAPRFAKLLESLRSIVASGKFGGYIPEARLKREVGCALSDVRDQIDVELFKLATREPMAANKLRAMRIVDEARRDMCHHLNNWARQAEFASLILDVPVEEVPALVGRINRGMGVRPEWLLRFSEYHGQFITRKDYKSDPDNPRIVPVVGPFHTANKVIGPSLFSVGRLLALVDPHSGRYSTTVVLGGGLGEFFDVISSVEDNLDLDDDGSGDILPPPEVVNEPNEVVEEAGLDYEELTFDDPETVEDELVIENLPWGDADQEAGHDVFGDDKVRPKDSAAPGNSKVSPDVAGKAGDALPLVMGLPLLARFLDGISLPMRVGILKALAEGAVGDDFLEQVFEEMDVFDILELPRELAALNAAALGKKMNPPVIAQTMRNRIKAAVKDIRRRIHAELERSHQQARSIQEK